MGKVLFYFLNFFFNIPVQTLDGSRTFFMDKIFSDVNFFKGYGVLDVNYKFNFLWLANITGTSSHKVG